MNFIEALQELVKGKKIRKRCWDKEQYLQIVDDIGYIKDEDNDIPTPIRIYNLDDLRADNWELYKECCLKEQTNLESIKFKMVRYCIETPDCQACSIHDDCSKKEVLYESMLDDWTKKEIIDAYKKLKKNGEI